MLDIAFELIGEATSNSLLMFCFCNLIIVMIFTGSSKPGLKDSHDSTFVISASYDMGNIASDHHDFGADDDEEMTNTAAITSVQDEPLIDDSSSDEEEDRESSHCYADDDDADDTDEDEDEDEDEDDDDDDDESEVEEEEEGDDDLRMRMFFPETMDPETTNIFAKDFSVEEFDIDFEFDAPRFYDFSKPELDSETEETELWFDSAGNYPPSPFSLNLRYDNKHLQIPKPISDQYNGFIYHNHAPKDVPKATHKSKTKPFLRKNSTLTRPTASLLARQNKPLDIYSVRLLTRCQRSLGKCDEKFSSLLYSMPQTQDNKRQKLETGFLRKVSRLDQTPFVHKVPRKGSKVTVPKEPNLKTAQRAARNRFKAQSAPEQIAKFISTMNKVPETSSPSLPKKNTNTPRHQDLQAFHLRTSLRARERSSSVSLKPFVLFVLLSSLQLQ
ncbi:TPX2 central domain [Arabidopsis thaliana x Arabidopsis arenosa]|uniref:TPX2 central domain n=1 Tax=Arabidopsis thaliana x Arabidopsis arenosa TaxID=1240361 RepID=A0A8T1YTV6_9BRAS|nr:TPX2 central domain [Arabidopsis thaliana x Arabidopsis arenosa]